MLQSFCFLSENGLIFPREERLEIPLLWLLIGPIQTFLLGIKFTPMYSFLTVMESEILLRVGIGCIGSSLNFSKGSLSSSGSTLVCGPLQLDSLLTQKALSLGSTWTSSKWFKFKQTEQARFGRSLAIAPSVPWPLMRKDCSTSRHRRYSLPTLMKCLCIQVRWFFFTHSAKTICQLVVLVRLNFILIP